MNSDHLTQNYDELGHFPENFPGKLQTSQQSHNGFFLFQKRFYQVYSFLKVDGLPVIFRKLLRKIRTKKDDPFYHFQGILEDSQKDYAAWISQNEPSPVELKEQEIKARELAYKPLFSILVPVYKTPLPVLQAMIESVKAQTYPNWELCIGNASPEDETLVRLLNDEAVKDPRVVVNHLEKNLGISGNSNEILKFCRGEFIGLLDHDDLLAPFALFEIASVLNRWPDSDFFYSDRDLINEDGNFRFSPFFKPDWSPEMLLSGNYLSQFNVFRKSLLEKSDVFDPQKDGSQDLDLYLRLTEISRRVVHIPRILYHWRLHSSSVSSGLQAKPYALLAQKEALKEFFDRRKLTAQIVNISPANVWLAWPVSEEKKVSVIIPLKSPTSKKIKRITQDFLKKTSYENLEFVFVCPGQDQNKLEDLPDVRFVCGPENKLLTEGCRQANGDLLLFLNEDLLPVYSGWLEEMIRWAERDSIGAVGALLLNPDRLIAYGGSVLAGGKLTQLFYGNMQERITLVPFGQHDWLRNLSFLTPDCVLVRREVLQDSSVLKRDLDDTGLVLQLCREITRSGKRVLLNPHAVLKYRKKKKLAEIDNLVSRYPDLFSEEETTDPFFNPNLEIHKGQVRISCKKVRYPGM